MTTLRYTYRFYPTDVQRQELAQLFGCVRVVYNWGIDCAKQARADGEKLPSYSALSSLLTQLKRNESYSWLADVSCVPLQQSLRHLRAAFSNMFQGRARKPRYKSRRDVQSAEFTRSAMRVEGASVKLGRITGAFDIRWSRELPNPPSSCTVTLDKAGRYHISFVVEVEVEPLPSVEQTVGIDLGLTHFVVDSQGNTWGNPRYLEAELEKLKKAQRKLARQTKGSTRYQKQRRNIARLHARIADKRHDYLHKLSTTLIRENQAIGVETLSVKTMVKNRALSRAISDAGWGKFVQMLVSKGARYGREVIKIERWYPSSKQCSGCGHRVESLPLSVREWQCQKCGASHDRDINAAINVKIAAGLAEIQNACGGRTAVQLPLAFG